MLLAELLSLGTLGLITGSLAAMAVAFQEGLLGFQVIKEVAGFGSAAQLRPAHVRLELLLVLAAVAHLDLALQELAVVHVRHADPQVDAAGLADGVQDDGILLPALPVHAQHDLLLVDVLEARDVFLILQEGQGVAVPFQHLPVAVPARLAAPLAVFARELQGLTEASHGVIQEEEALGRPQGAAVMGVELPVHHGMALGFGALGSLVLGLELLAGVLEDGVGAALVEVELLTVQGVDVGVTPDAATPARGESPQTSRASQIHLHRAHVRGQELQDRRVAVLARAIGGGDVLQQTVLRAVELHEGGLLKIPELHLIQALKCLEGDGDQHTRMLSAVVDLAPVAVLGPNGDGAVLAALQVLVHAPELLAGVQNQEGPRARLAKARLRLRSAASGRDRHALDGIRLDLGAMTEAIEVELREGLPFAEALVPTLLMQGMLQLGLHLLCLDHRDFVLVSPVSLGLQHAGSILTILLRQHASQPCKEQGLPHGVRFGLLGLQVTLCLKLEP